ncbi:MAG: hypothetical protein F4Z73_02835, partial [Synechococcus sp. SB0668_bin_13]|nr:hypothetical protein [Synechococcus sp. SB0668_bin_13]
NPNNSDVTGYEYQQKAGGGSYGSWTAISGSSATTVSHTVSGLTNGTAYSFRIRAVAGSVNGAQSDEATATPVAAAPGKPTGFSATAGNGAVSLAWSNPNNSDVTGYEYQQKAGGGSYGSWTAISGSSATTVSHTVSGLTNGTAYSFRIRAVAGSVNGAQSDEATATPVADDRDNGGGGGDRATTPPPSRPSVRISGGDDITEGEAARFTVRRTGGTTQALNVLLTVSEQEGEGRDFVATGNEGSQQVTIPAGERSAVHTVPTVDDDTDEPHGAITVAVETDSAYDTGNGATATVAVQDNDETVPAEPVISISGGPAVTEGDPVVFTLSANPDSIEEIMVNVMVSNNGSTAAGGQTGPRTVTIPPSRVATLTVLTEDDATDEPDGQIIARVLPGPGYSLEQSSAVATVVVVDDDQPAVVASPSRLTVAAGDSGRYTVALDRQPYQDRTLTISSDAPASDLSIQPRRLLFTPSNWATPQTVTITPHTTLPGPVTLSHALTGDGAGVSSTVTVTVIAAAPAKAAPQGWLTRLGRTVSQQVVDALRDRFNAPPPLPGLRLTVAGEDLTSATPLVGNQQALSKTLGFQPVTTKQLVQDSNFSFSPPPAEQEGQEESAPHFALWGQGAFSSFQGAEEAVSLEGNVTTALVGAEWSSQRWQAGAALSRSWGDGSYEGEEDRDGDLNSTLTALFPYGRYGLTPRLGLWAVAGYGWGQLSLQPDGMDGEYQPGANLGMAAVGMDGILLDGGAEDLSLTTTADLLSLTTTSEAVDGLDASEGNVTRFRLGIEAERPFPLSDGASLLPSLEIGVRQDSGDAESGFGVEVAAGLSWNAPERGISADLHGRTLLAHAEEQFREQGVALSFSWDPDPSNRGPSFSLGRSLGATAEGGMDALLKPTVLQELDDDGNGQQQLEATLAYGFPAYNNRLTLTPGLAVALSSTSRTYSLLWSVAPYAQLGQAEPWQLSLEGERQEDNNPDSSANHSLNLRFSLPF